MKIFTPIRLVVITILLGLGMLITNILAAMRWPDYTGLMAIVTGILLMIWLIFFSIQIFKFYLQPKALMTEVFRGINYQVKVSPTEEIYSGVYESIPFRCEIKKGRDRIKVYVYLMTDNRFILAAGRQKPLLIKDSLVKIENMPERINNYFIASDQPGTALPWLQQKEVTDILGDFLANFDGEIYWEKEQIRVIWSLQHPHQIMQALRAGVKLRQS